MAVSESLESIRLPLTERVRIAWTLRAARRPTDATREG
jgi:hypothetical protein